MGWWYVWPHSWTVAAAPLVHNELHWNPETWQIANYYINIYVLLSICMKGMLVATNIDVLVFICMMSVVVCTNIQVLPSIYLYEECGSLH